MIANEADVFNSALALPPERREALVHVLLDSLPAAASADIESAWSAEVDRRIEEFEADRSKARPAADVFAKYARKSG